MKIAISNIAWNPEENDEVAEILNHHQVKAIEVAPTKIWANPANATREEIDKQKNYWNNKAIQIVAAQSILFGHPEMEIFKDFETRQLTFDYIVKMLKLVAGLGAKAVVFGSPKNRKVAGLDPTQALEIAVAFFGQIAEAAQKYGISFCLEPNPPLYGADFILNTKEALALIQKINHPYFRLNLDTGIMTINQEDYFEALKASLPYLGHFHISEPQLALVGNGGVEHAQVAAALKELGYNGWVSVEMRDGLKSPNTKAVEKALAFVTKTYA